MFKKKEEFIPQNEPTEIEEQQISEHQQELPIEKQRELSEQDFLKTYEHIEENLEIFGVYELEYKYVSTANTPYYMITVSLDIEKSTQKNTQQVQQYLESIKTKHINYELKFLNYMYWCKIIAGELGIPVELTVNNVLMFKYMDVPLIRLALDRAGVYSRNFLRYENWVNGGFPEVET